VAEITPEWLTAALAASEQPAVVRSVEVQRFAEGMGNRRAFLGLYPDGSGRSWFDTGFGARRRVETRKRAITAEKSEPFYRRGRAASSAGSFGHYNP
jgi:hypothetical protein